MIASIQMVLTIALAATAALLASRHAVRRPFDATWLAGLTLAIAWPLWVTCDRYLLQVLPTVWWFGPSEPFAPYFLLYLPLSVLLAVTPAAALIVVARRGAAWIRRHAPFATER